jgi:hypothetical protein
MYRFKNSLIAFAGLFVLPGLIALATPTTSVGQSGKQPTPQDVRVVGTSVTQPVSASAPLPVEGSVNIVNTPTVALQATSPTPVRSAENPDRQRVLLWTSMETGGGFGLRARSEFKDINGRSFVVAPGKRLVVEFVTMDCHEAGGQKVLLYVGVDNHNGVFATARFNFPLIAQQQGTFNDRDRLVVSQELKFFLDSGFRLVGEMESNGDQSAFCAGSVHGYLTDMASTGDQ